VIGFSWFSCALFLSPCRFFHLGLFFAASLSSALRQEYYFDPSRNRFPLIFMTSAYPPAHGLILEVLGEHTDTLPSPSSNGFPISGSPMGKSVVTPF